MKISAFIVSAPRLARIGSFTGRHGQVSCRAVSLDFSQHRVARTRAITAMKIAVGNPVGTQAVRGGIPGVWDRIQAKLGIFAWFIPFLLVVALVTGLFEYKYDALRQFKDTVAKLPSTDHIDSIELFGLRDAYKYAPEFNAEVKNVEGKKASIAIFHALLSEFGVINHAAAKKGLLLYGPFVEEAKRRPGMHPNIDLLFQVCEDPKVALIGKINLSGTTSALQ